MNETTNPFAGLDGPSVQGEGRKLPAGRGEAPSGEGGKLPVAKPVEKTKQGKTSRVPYLAFAALGAFVLLATAIVVAGALIVVSKSGSGQKPKQSNNDSSQMTTQEKAKWLIGKGFAETKSMFGEPDQVAPTLSTECWSYFAPLQEGAAVRRRYSWVDVYFKETRESGQVRWKVYSVRVVENGKTSSTP